jgi:hypothetical protein
MEAMCAASFLLFADAQLAPQDSGIVHHSLDALCTLPACTGSGRVVCGSFPYFQAGSVKGKAWALLVLTRPPLVATVARPCLSPISCSLPQRDPGEYLSELRRFAAVKDLRLRRHAIDCHLGRWEAALGHLVATLAPGDEQQHQQQQRSPPQEASSAHTVHGRGEELANGGTNGTSKPDQADEPGDAFDQVRVSGIRVPTLCIWIMTLSAMALGIRVVQTGRMSCARSPITSLASVQVKHHARLDDL